jgi:hypothetical protein
MAKARRPARPEWGRAPRGMACGMYIGLGTLILIIILLIILL